jgi:hypothetical protein
MSDPMMKTIDDAIAEIFRLRAALAELRTGIKRLSDEEEMLAETTDGEEFTLVSIAAKLAKAEADRDAAKERCAAAVDDYNNSLAMCTELAKALKDIAAPRECGCSPVCHCMSEESLLIESDTMRDIARSALASYREESGQ